MKKLTSTIVKSNNEIAPGAFILSFTRWFDFIPGQVIAMAANPASEPRLYSIASGNTQNDVWILYTIKTDGMLTPELSRLKPGDSLWVSEPFGRFTCNDDKALWIATGTGIAPFASMFFSGQSKNKILIQGNRNLSGLYFQNDFKSLMQQNYISCCSREENTGCFPGRVTDYLLSVPDIDTSLPYYLCGSAEMVVDVRDLLIKKGVAFHKIMAEIFF